MIMTKRVFGNSRLTSTPRAGLHHKIARKIGSLIARGSLAPGEVLPNETSLGIKFGVSRTALREAMKVLASKGLIEVRRKTGTRVRPSTDWNLLDPDVLSWLFSGPEVPGTLIDLMDVRKTVEPASARMAAGRATEENLREIEGALQGMELAINDLPSSIEPDLQFHLAILKATHNIFMKPFGALIQTALRASFKITSSDQEAYERTLALHRAVFVAIKSRNEREAEGAMILVLAQTSKDMEVTISRTPAVR